MSIGLLHDFSAPILCKSGNTLLTKKFKYFCSKNPNSLVKLYLRPRLLRERFTPDLRPRLLRERFTPDLRVDFRVDFQS